MPKWLLLRTIAAARPVSLARAEIFFKGGERHHRAQPALTVDIEQRRTAPLLHAMTQRMRKPFLKALDDARQAEQTVRGPPSQFRLDPLFCLNAGVLLRNPVTRECPNGDLGGLLAR